MIGSQETAVNIVIGAVPYLFLSTFPNLRMTSGASHGNR